MPPRRAQLGRGALRVYYQLGGRRTRIRYAGSFKRRADAIARKAWVTGELAAMRVPDLQLGEVERVTVSTAADRWLATRIDVAETTKTRHEVELKRIKRVLGDRAVDAITAAAVAEFVAGLARESYSRGTIRKTLQTLAMVFDHAGIEPNPARDKQVRLPREDEEELNPPTDDHVEAVFHLLPSKHRLAYSVPRPLGRPRRLDRHDARQRLRRAPPTRPAPGSTTKTRRALWVELPDVLADAIEAELGPREDRDPEARLFGASGADALRTSIAKGCKAAGVPLFSPHDLRHRRISLLHLQGWTWAEIGAFVGQRSLATTADVYTHVLVDSAEVDYRRLLAERAGRARVSPRRPDTGPATVSEAVAVSA